MSVKRQYAANHERNTQAKKTNNKYCNKNKTTEQINDKIGTIRKKNGTDEWSTK